MAILCVEVLLGTLTFTGSLMATGKLQEILPQRPITFKGQNIFNFTMLGAALACGVVLAINPPFGIFSRCYCSWRWFSACC